MTKVTLKNKRGLNLVAELRKASESSIVILLHGFTGDKHEWGRLDALAESLHTAGISVLALDFSGSGESDNDTLSVKKQIDDFKSTLEYVQDNGYEHIGVVGLSLGGLVALESFNENIEALVLWAPVTNKRKNYTQRFTPEQQQELKGTGVITKIRDKGVRRKIVIDKSIIEERESVDQKSLLKKINIPVLIVHGDSDEVVPIDDSKNAVKLLPSGSRLEIIPNADHGFYDQLQEFINVTVAWFRNHLD